MSKVKNVKKTIDVMCAKHILTAIQNHAALTNDFRFIKIFIKDFIDEVGSYSNTDFFQTLCLLYNIGYIRAEMFDESTPFEKVIIYDVTYEGYEFCQCAKFSNDSFISVSQIDDWIAQTSKLMVGKAIQGTSGKLTV